MGNPQFKSIYIRNYSGKLKARVDEVFKKMKLVVIPTFYLFIYFSPSYRSCRMEERLLLKRYTSSISVCSSPRLLKYRCLQFPFLAFSIKKDSLRLVL